MYCGQCGKKIVEGMLFCPFCGSRVVIPEQDDQEPMAHSEPENAPVSPAPVPLQAQQHKPVSLFENVDAPAEAVQAEYPQVPQQEPEEEIQEEVQEDFVPLNLEAPQGVEDSREDMEVTHPGVVPQFVPPKEESEVQRQSYDVPERTATVSARPIQRSAPRQIKRPDAPRKQTFIPVKEVDLDNMFMDDLSDGDPYDEDDYDVDEAPVRSRYYEEDYSFEEPEHGGFFQRHIRGIVALILLAILGIVFGVWIFSDNGQRVLASANLAWNAQSYADLGYEAYQQNNDLQAARYYERALERDGSNYEYAHSAMVAYYEANQIESAAAMLKKCIEMDPDNPEPYHEMLILYPDAANRPWEIQELIRLGFQRTGDQSLNLDAGA